MIRRLKLQRPSILFAIVIHLVAGVLIAFVPSLVYYWQLAVLIVGIIDIIQSRNRNGEAGLWAAYFSGMEVVARMTSQSVFWELGKYAVVLFLVVGLLLDKRTLRLPYLIYFSLLLPSIFIASYVDLAQARDMISFNLSGPLCLAVSGLYFYKQKVAGPMLLELIRSFVLPVLVMVAYLFLQTPEVSSIVFDGNSNFSASGGYGPNQVSLILGVGIFLLIMLRYYSISFSGLRWLDYVLISILLFRALITFSRGGVFGAALALGVFLILHAAVGYGGRRIGNSILISIFIISVSLLVWNYTNTITDNALSYRYAGFNSQTGKGKEYSTGRVEILTRDIDIFSKNPLLGIGPGKSKLEALDNGKMLATHTEWSRMLAEHGIFGLVALLILIFVPLAHVLDVPVSVRPLLLAIVILSMFSMFHSAMRLAVIGYLYGLALIIPVSEKGTVRRQ